jgi:hypothetical protein
MLGFWCFEVVIEIGVKIVELIIKQHPKYIMGSCE